MRITAKVFGKFLNNIRPESQRTVTDNLGYKNINFVSMIERGQANIPLERVRDFAREYGVDEKIFIPLVLIVTYPAAWEMFKVFNVKTGLIKDPADMEKEVEEYFMTKLREFGLMEQYTESLNEPTTRVAKAI